MLIPFIECSLSNLAAKMNSSLIYVLVHVCTLLYILTNYKNHFRICKSEIMYPKI